MRMIEVKMERLPPNPSKELRRKMYEEHLCKLAKASPYFMHSNGGMRGFWNSMFGKRR